MGRELVVVIIVISLWEKFYKNSSTYSNKKRGSHHAPPLTYEHPTQISMVVVAVDHLAVPRKEGGKTGVLDRIGFANSLEPLGLDGAARGVDVGTAFPSHRAGGVLDGAKALNLHAGLGHGDHFGEAGDARLIAVGADEDVTDLGNDTDSSGVHSM